MGIMNSETHSSISRPATGDDVAFGEIVDLIRQAHGQALRAVNTALIDLYWTIGEQISRRIAEDGWGKRAVAALAEHIRKSQPNSRRFPSQNLRQMRQFFGVYFDQPKLSTLLRELPWSANLHILTESKRLEEREFYTGINFKGLGYGE